MRPGVLVVLAASVAAFVYAVAAAPAVEAPAERSARVVALARTDPSRASALPRPPVVRRTPQRTVARASLRPLSFPTHEERESDDARALDELATTRFDAAFAPEPRDEDWATTTEAEIAAAIAATDHPLRIESLECRATLCRVTVIGDRDALPTAPPFDGIVWWSDRDEGTATLMIVRDGAEPPLPAEDELG